MPGYQIDPCASSGASLTTQNNLTSCLIHCTRRTDAVCNGVWYSESSQICSENLCSTMKLIYDSESILYLKGENRKIIKFHLYFTKVVH